MPEKDGGTPRKRREKPPEKFLSYETYVARFAKDVGSLQRLWLVPLALGAFWLAIENSYQTFQRIPQSDRAFEESERSYNRQSTKLDQYRKDAAKRPTAERAAKPADGAAGAGKAPVKASGQARPPNLEQEKAELERLARRRDEQEQRKEKLRSEAVNLTVAGTVMPSRLSYAPTLWLAAFLTWLLYFETVKFRAQRHLAAAVAAYGRKPIPFGLAEENSLWLAPIPDEIRLRMPDGTGVEPVPRSSILAFLGWTENDDRRSRLVAGLAWVALLGLTIRLLFVSAEVNSAFAVAENITGASASYINSIRTAIVASLCFVLLVRLILARSGQDYRETRPSRRQFVAFGAGALALLLFIWNKPRLRGTGSGASEAAAAAGAGDLGGFGSQPRFVSAANKAKRAQRRIELRLARSGDLLIKHPAGDRNASRGPLSFHGVGSNGLARFYAEPPRFMRRITPAAFRILARNARYPGGPAIPDRRHTAPLEAAALALIERGEGGDGLRQACDVLLGACQLSLGARRPNLRLFDLLAGLARRYPEARQYRAELEALISDPGGGASPSPELRGRIAAWKKPKWAARWQSRKPLLWGHPLELTAGRAWWRVWSDKPRKTARPVPLPPSPLPPSVRPGLTRAAR